MNRSSHEGNKAHGGCTPQGVLFGLPKDKTLRSKKLVYCLRIKGRELCDSYAAAWNDLDLKRDLRKRRDQMLSDPLDIVLDVIRGET